MKRAGLASAVAALLGTLLSASSPVWWQQRGVTVPNASPDDYAVANVGQLKHIAQQAAAEMDALLPDGAGPEISQLVHSWTAPAAENVVRNDYAALTQGQLKAVAKLFYDRLAAVGAHGPPLAHGAAYPWTVTTSDDASYAPANLGQLKFLFSFDVFDNDQDGLPDNWERLYFGHLNNTGGEDPGGVGRTLLQSYQQGLSPWPAPTVSAGLRAWYRADKGVIKDENNRISQWTDLSGQGLHVLQMADPGRQPLLTNNALNGQPAVSFDSAQLLLQTPRAVDVQGSGDDRTLIVVLRPAAQQTGEMTILDEQWGEPSYNPALRTVGGNNQVSLLWMGNEIAGVRSVPQFNLTAGEVQILSAVKNGATASSYLNGVGLGSNLQDDATLSHAPGYWAIGNRPNAPYYGFQGEIAEVLIYNRALTETERQQVETALTTKYVNPDADGDGLLDTWEDQHLGTRTYTGGEDPGGVGRTLLQSYQQGLSPWPAPTVSAGLRAWYRADKGVIKDENNRISQWTDLSGQGLHVLQMADPGRQPLLTNNALNGQPAVSFDSAQLLLQTPRAVDVQGSGDDRTLIVVLRPAAQQTGEMTILDEQWGEPSYNPALRTVGGNNQVSLLWMGNEIAGVRSVPQFNLTAGEVQILSAVKNGATASSYLNGVGLGSNLQDDATLSHAPGYWAIGNRPNAPYYGFQGEIAEVLIYNRALTETERQQVETALTTKYVNPDADGDGLLDTWEDQHLGTRTYTGGEDPGGVGRTLLQSYQQGLSPWPAPTVSAGLRAWYRADKGVIKDENNRISQWTDLSGQGLHVLQMADPGRQPLLTNNALNGQPAVSFDSAQLLLQTPRAVDVQGSGDDRTLIVVLRPAAQQTGEMTILDEQWGEPSYNPALRTVGGNNQVSLLWMGNEIAGVRSVPQFNLTAGEVQILSAVKNGATASSYLNGVGLGSNLQDDATLSHAPGYWAIGNRPNAPYYGFQGEIAEVLIYNRALTETERQQVETALTTKYVNPDADGDGLLDTWEDQHLGTRTYTGGEDPGGVGRTLLQSYQQGLSPWPAPTVSAGLRAWYRADKGVIKDENNRISQWTDLSGQAFHVRQTIDNARRPLLVADAINHKAALEFDSTQVLQSSGFADVCAGSDDETLFVVAVPSAVQGDRANVVYLGHGEQGYFADGLQGDSNNNYMMAWPGDYAPAVTATPNAVQIFSAVKEAAQAASFLNGTAVASRAVQPEIVAPPAVMAIGNGTHPYYGFNGRIAEVLIYNRALTAAERQQVETALKFRYGIVDPNGDADGDGLSNADELARGTDPYAADTDGDGLDDGLEVAIGTNPLVSDLDSVPSRFQGRRLHLRADAGLTLNGQFVSQWNDLSGNNNHAVNTQGGRQPVKDVDAVSGAIAVKFDGLDDYLQLPNVTAGMTQGEIFAVVRRQASTGGGTIWSFGSGSNVYPQSNNTIQEAFGTSSARIGPPVSADLTKWQLYNVRASASGWESRITGKTYLQAAGNTVSFSQTSPILGWSINTAYGSALNGAVAELIVYDHVLTEQERAALGVYFNLRHHLVTVASAPAGLAAAGISASQIVLSWQEATTTNGGLTYEIERRSSTGDFAVVAEVRDGTMYFDSAVVAGETYTYRVKARNYAGDSPYSNEASASPGDGAAMPLTGMRLWLRGETLTSGAVEAWEDMSGSGNTATNTNAIRQPSVQIDPVTDRKTVRFDGVDDYLQLPNVTAGMTQGEVFVVVKAATVTNGNGQALWSFGSGTALYVPGNAIYETFGTNVRRDAPGANVDLTKWTLYNVSAESNGNWSSRLNGQNYYSVSGNTVSFSNATPTLGGGVPITGAIAEIIVYDHALTEGERTAVGFYLNLRHGFVSPPPVPGGLTAKAISASQISLSWAETPNGAGTTFAVERKTGSGDFVSVAEVKDVFSYIDSALNPTATYTYRVKARTYGGSSGYSNEASATTFDTGAPMPNAGMRLWLKGETQAAGPVLTWRDQSGNNNHAFNNNANRRPVAELEPQTGRMVVRFDGVDDYLQLPNVTGGMTQGEVFVVVKSATVTNGNGQALWTFGSGTALYVPGNAIYETFGTNVRRDAPGANVDLTKWTLYNVSAEPNGNWSSRLNGQDYYSVSGNTVSFSNATPTLGGGVPITGAIAELIVYDHVLTNAERSAVGTYLAQRHAFVASPQAPTPLTAQAVSGSQISLGWAGAPNGSGTTFVVERKTGAGDFAPVTEVKDVFSYIDSALTASTAYTYRVKAKTYAGSSGYSNEASATTFDTGSAMPTTGIRLWLKGETQPPGRVLTWLDQSGNNNHAFNTNTARQPQAEVDAQTGRIVVRFDGVDDMLQLPNVTAGMTQGEAFVVVKTAPAPDNNGRRLWSLGSADAYFIPDNRLFDGFGTSTRRDGLGFGADFSQWTLYNVSAEAGGKWSNRLNGKKYLTITGNTVSFTSTAPQLGGGRPLDGPIAELIVYDHALTEAERTAVAIYLNQRHGFATPPGTPTALTAGGISPTQISLSWSGLVRRATTAYVIERKSGAADYAPLAEVQDVCSFIDATVAAGTNYTYRVKARTYAGSSSGYSNEAGATSLVEGSAMPLSGVRLWFKGESLGQGAVPRWPDLSGNSNDAGTTFLNRQPVAEVDLQTNRTVVRFDGLDDALQLPDVTAGMTQGEAFVLVKAAPVPDGNGRWLWSLGRDATGFGIGNTIAEGFGTSVRRDGPTAGPDLTQWQLYNVSASATGWESRISGQIYQSFATNTVSFSSTAPVIGGSRSIDGAIAEVIVYDHPLTEQERLAVGFYFSQRYGFLAALAVPTNLAASAVSPTEVCLTWTMPAATRGTTYQVDRRAGSGNYQRIGTATGPSFFDRTAPAGTTCAYRVRAVNYAGYSAFSADASVVTAATGAAAAFPTTGLKLWLDASTLGNADTVSTWRELSGASNHATQAAAPARPLVIQNQLAGLPVVRFDGTDDVLQLPGFLSGATAAEVFVVVRAGTFTPARNLGLWQFGPGDSLYSASNGTTLESFGSSVTRSGPVPLQALTQYHTYNISAQAGEWISRVNDIPYVLAAANTVQFRASFQLGVADTGRFGGDIAEILVFDRVLAPEERESVNRYLNVKYRLVPEGYANVNAFNFDSDGDGLSNAAEAAAGSNPYATDTDGDGMPDGWEVAHGLNPLVADALADADGDGRTNLEEYLAGTDPTVADAADPAAPVQLKIYHPVQRQP
ncbi:MAG: fibronectin type III domain-containing protein [Candidatus Didemnitutus sp.]|nr:fibronectin type III domain-containing protein [Candidatus Didemnitutus sp.]